MAARGSSLLVSLLMGLSCHAYADADVSVDNALAACVELTPAGTETIHGMTAVHLRVVEKQSTADCGCKSAVSSFSVQAKRQEYSSLLLQGRLLLAGKRDLTLPLTLDAQLVGDAPVVVSFSCANPD